MGMRILVACEFSGRVRDAFARRGHDAWSCDFLPSESPGNHIQGDVRPYLAMGRLAWDMVIAFPPCTYLCSSGLHWNKRIPERQKLTEEALLFVTLFFNAGIPKMAIENPIGCISTKICKPAQIYQPWMFGVPESKATCLWLNNLPLLRPTNILPLPASGRWSNQTPTGQNKLGPSPDRWKDRSRTHVNIAEAMASQWG